MPQSRHNLSKKRLSVATPTTTGQRGGRQGKQLFHLLYRSVQTHMRIFGVNSEAQAEQTAVHKTQQSNKQSAPEQLMASASCISPSLNPEAATKGGLVTSQRLFCYRKILLG
jgi:hypothetical protein